MPRGGRRPGVDGDAQFGRLIVITFIERPTRRILRSRLSFLRHLGRPRAVAGENLPNVGGPFEHCLPLYTTEPLDPDALVRAVMNPELMSHFFDGEAKTMDLRAGLAAAKCPVLVLGGELDPVMPPEMVQEVVDALPAQFRRFEELAGVSHLQVGGRATGAIVRAFIQTTS